MTVNDRYTESGSGTAGGGELIIDASGTDTGVVQITELGGTGDAEVYREIDEGQTGTFEVSSVIDTRTGEWHNPDNALLIGNDGTSNELRLRIVNTTASSYDYYAVGFEAGTQ